MRRSISFILVAFLLQLPAFSARPYRSPRPYLSKSVTILSPTASEDVTLFFSPEEIDILQVTAVVVGNGSPTVDYDIHHGTDRSAAGTQLFGTDEQVSSTTAGDDVTTFAAASVAEDSFVWLKTSATGGTTVTELNITILYREL